MCITTFLHQSEIDVPLEDKELQLLLEEVRSKTGENWQVVGHPILIRRSVLFGKTETQTVWSLYKYVGGMGPWQAINFYRDGATTSINPTVTLELIAAYLYGILAGLHSSKSSN